MAQTKERKLEIAEYVKTHSVRDAEIKFHVAHRTIRNIAHELGVRIYRKKPRVRETILLHPELSARQIAQRFGLNHRSVKSAKWELENPRKKKIVRVRVHLLLYGGNVRLPMTQITDPYNFLGESVVDLEGLTGIHRGVPVSSLVPSKNT